jgi:hypothetical protein
MQTRDEVLREVKDTALRYVERGQLREAFTAFVCDLGKHPELAVAYAACRTLGMLSMVAGQLDTAEKMTKFIEGCR